MGKSIISKFIGREEESIIEEETTTDTNDNQTEASEGPPQQPQQQWLDDNEEGELSVDVFQTPEHVVIKSTIAGVKPEDIDISINNDMLTVRGERRQEEEIRKDDYIYQECYWGSFSRSIILPVEVKAEEVDASLKNGVLTIKLPKAQKAKSVSIKVNAE